MELARWPKASVGPAHSHGLDEARVWAVEIEARVEVTHGRVSNNERHTNDCPTRSVVQVSF